MRTRQPVGLTARFAGRDDLQHSFRHAVSCSRVFTEAPWLEPARLKG
jgi:hypothetical protein